eukprot:127488-Rhodomonas_salina.3
MLRGLIFPDKLPCLGSAVCAVASSTECPPCACSIVFNSLTPCLLLVTTARWHGQEAQTEHAQRRAKKGRRHDARERESNAKRFEIDSIRFVSMLFRPYARDALSHFPL